MKFRTTIRQSGKTATGIPVPPEVVEGLGAGKKPPVTVTINGHSYRSTVAVMGGDFMIALSGENRAAAGVAGGDEVEVDLVLDNAPREVAVPAVLAEALSHNPSAQQFFAGLSYSNRLRHVLGIEDAKTPDTRQRRIAKTVDMFAEGKS